jgi:hypothetical protein
LKGIKVDITTYKSLAPANNKIMIYSFLAECDTCKNSSLNELVSHTLDESLKSINLTLSNGTEYSAGHYKGLLYKSKLDGVIVKYFAAIIQNRSFLYIETLGDIDENISGKYLGSLILQPTTNIL